MRRVIILALSMTVLATIGAGAASAAATEAEATKRMGIRNFEYVPNPRTVAPGETVQVGNLDGYRNDIPHSVTSDDGLFDTGVYVCCVRSFVAPAAPGSYDFFCEVHPFMSGTLVVSG